MRKSSISNLKTRNPPPLLILQKKIFLKNYKKCNLFLKKTNGIAINYKKKKKKWSGNFHMDGSGSM